jgi:uncharacterized protein (DUF1499 family)
VVVAQTDFQVADPLLRPPKYQRRKADMFAAIVELIEDQPSYRIVSKDAAACRLKAERRTSLLRFVDDVEIWVEGEPSGPVSVHMRSQQRKGFYDFGRNKKNIREFTRLLHHRQS